MRKVNGFAAIQLIDATSILGIVRLFCWSNSSSQYLGFVHLDWRIFT